MTKLDSNKKFTVYYRAVLLFAAVIYAVLAAKDAIWADEAYTFAMVHHSFPEIWRITAADVHPPLYYFLVKLTTAVFGYSQYSVRMVSAACYLILLAVGGRQLRTLFGEKTAALFMGLFLLYPFGLGYAVEARMYSLGALTVFLNALFACRCWKENRPADWAGFAAAGTCAAYTHYFALVSAGLIYGLLFLCILLKKRKLLKPWLLASAVTIVLYLPWLKSFVEQLAFKVSNDYWIEPITIRTLFSYAMELLYANGFGAFPLYFGVTLLAVLVFVIRKGDWEPLLALAVPVGTALLGIGVSFLIRPIFIVRYLASSAPLLIFFLAWGLTAIPWEKAVCILVALFMGFSSNLLYSMAGLRPEADRLDAAFTAECGDAEAYVVNAASSLHVSQVLSYYEPVTPIYVPDSLGADNPYPNKYELDTLDLSIVDSWVLLTDADAAPPEEMAEGYTAEYYGRIHNSYNIVDVWRFTK